MATMIPDIDPGLIENSGEQRFYEAGSSLPPAYTVYYSYKFSPGEYAEHPDTLYEADFIITHSQHGYLVVEVKEGQYQYFNNRWQKQLGSDFIEVEKDPLEQAERAMYNILNKYKQAAGQKYFPLKIRHALCFPDCYHLAGNTPDNLKPESILLCGDLEQLEQGIKAVFGPEARAPDEQALKVLDKFLAPTFKVFSSLVAQMELFSSRAEKVLTVEQQRILDETEYDRRKIFYGAAGTGKTYIATEKVRRLLQAGKSVLLTCFNRNLGFYLQKELAGQGEGGQADGYQFSRSADAAASR